MSKWLVVLTLLLVSALSAQQPGDPPLIQQNNLVYAGAFRLPASGLRQEQNYAYGGGATAVNPNGGTLFVAGHDWFQWIGEIAAPALRIGTTLHDLNTATVVQPLAPGRQHEFQSIAGGGIALGGLLVSGSDLIMTAVATYDGTGAQRETHFKRPTTNLQSTVPLQGPYTLDSVGAGFVSGYMTMIPADWQGLLGGRALVGQCCISIIGRTSLGPSATVFDPADLGVVAPAPASMLVGYPITQPTLGECESSNKQWNCAARMGGAVFPAGTRSVLFFGRQGLGNYCYGNGGTTAPASGHGEGGVGFCYDPTDSSKGTHAYPYAHQVWAYDALDLLAVRNGTKQPWQVVPYATWNFDLPLQTGSRVIRSVAYDPASKRIYVVAAFGDGEKPLVHVFKVNVGGVLPPDGGEPPADTPHAIPPVAPGHAIPPPAVHGGTTPTHAGNAPTRRARPTLPAIRRQPTSRRR